VRTLPEELRRRLANPLPGLPAQLRMAPKPRMMPDAGVTLRPAAALLLIYPHENEWHVPLTVRGSGLRHHTGQVSLPGGRLDHPGESVEDAALREAHEEIGVAPASVELLGRLTPLPIAVSGHMLHPVIGVAAGRPAFALAADEVERLIELPVARLLQPDVIAWEERMRTAIATEAALAAAARDAAERFDPRDAAQTSEPRDAARTFMVREPEVLVNVPYFAIAGARVWGATAMVLAEFIAVLEDINFHAEA
jgi:8-oxo-dGTP pyrophosphatase MutT (NUDIX family)